MPQGSWFDQFFPTPPPTAGLPPLAPGQPLEQTNPGLAKLRDLVGGALGTRDALTPTSSNAALLGALLSAVAPVAAVLKRGSQAESAAATGIRAYHGSPHDFEQFSSAKIGTGEGAQAYGHGLYFAESEAVANQYKKDLGLKVPAFDDVPVKNFAEGMAHEYLKGGKDTALERLDRDVRRGLFAGAKDTKRAEDVRAAIIANQDKTPGMKVQGKLYEVAIQADPAEAFLQWDQPLRNQPASVRRLIGYPDRPADAEVAAVLAKAKAAGVAAHTLPEYQAMDRVLDERSRLDTLYPTGADIYHEMVGPGGKAVQKEATDTLLKAGVKGIQYRDAASRSSAWSDADLPFLEAQVADHRAALQTLQDRLSRPVSARQRPVVQADVAKAERELASVEHALKYAKAQPAPTHNYVVFDDALIQIQKKYGVAAPQALAIQQWLAQQDTVKTPAPTGDVHLRGDIRLPKE